MNPWFSDMHQCNTSVIIFLFNYVCHQRLALFNNHFKTNVKVYPKFTCGYLIREKAAKIGEKLAPDRGFSIESWHSILKRIKTYKTLSNDVNPSQNMLHNSLKSVLSKKIRLFLIEKKK